MELIATPPTDTPRSARSRSRLKAAVGGLILAGLLVGGSASVFAASPEPTDTGSTPAATETITDSSTDTGTRGDCPDKDKSTDMDTDTESSS
jgi:hypothetical protein